MSNQHALVIGGSIGGLLAARVLADHFEKVTIVDRDTLPAEPTVRNGAPQARHIHLLLVRGLIIMEDLFPGIREEFLANGAHVMHYGTDLRTRVSGGWLNEVDTDVTSIVCSRTLIEWTLRQRVLKDERITFKERTQVVGLMCDPTCTTVTGLRLRERGAGGREYEQCGDFVVDSSGRGSKAGEWLKSMGYAPPTETIVDPQASYATRVYEVPEGGLPWKTLYTPAVAPEKHGGGIIQIENGLMMASLGSYGGAEIPMNDESYLAHAQNLSTPDFYNAIKDATPVSKVTGYSRTRNQFRHYERLTRFPQRFAVTADAACAFNPIYGQGMSSAAIGAETLGDVLTSGSLDGAGVRFQKALARKMNEIWVMSTGEDMRHETTIGAKAGPLMKLQHKYLDLINDAAPTDDIIADAFYQVINLVKPSSSLLHPRIVQRVVRYLLNKRQRTEAEGEAIPAPQ